jgi:nitrite reductase (NAD(P)H)
MADILAFNLTQTVGHAPRKMNAPDLSTKLKLMGVDVASFGDYFADERLAKEVAAAEAAAQQAAPKHEHGVTISTVKPSRKRPRNTRNDAVKCLTYSDPISATYRKYIFTADGSHLLGGIVELHSLPHFETGADYPALQMIGDTGAFTKLVSIVKKKKKLDVPPSQFILGAKKEEDDGADLDDDVVVCSCHATTKGAISQCVKNGITELADIKCKTKAGTGCGGCLPLVTSIFKSEMKKAGNAVSNKCVVVRRLPKH